MSYLSRLSNDVNDINNMNDANKPSLFYVYMQCTYISVIHVYTFELIFSVIMNRQAQKKS